MGVAFLDGKTPCLLVQRGTYTLMKLVAYQLREGRLTELWRWDSDEEVGEVTYRGQGAHWMHCGDVDDDGRDEVVLGSNVIDDDGRGLWCTGLGHPDRCFLGDLDPERPGLEVFYHIEPPRAENGVCLVDAKTGAILWGLKERTYHVGVGMAADIDPSHPGCECGASEDGKGDPKGQNYAGNPPRWLLTAQGELLARDRDVPPFETVFWDADSQRELVAGSRVQKYQGPVLTFGIEGSHVFWGDILGDWREEIVTSVKGELRVYSTTIPAADRRVTLLQDPVYRADVAHEAMGYTQPPTPGRFVGAATP
jgi:rhamnogalacturonan endolyase